MPSTFITTMTVRITDRKSLKKRRALSGKYFILNSGKMGKALIRKIH